MKIVVVVVVLKKKTMFCPNKKIHTPDERVQAAAAAAIEKKTF